MARKRPQTPIGNATGKIKKTLSLDASTARKVAAYASYHGLDESEVYASAVLVHMRGFQVYQRDMQTEQADGPSVRLVVEDHREREAG